MGTSGPARAVNDTSIFGRWFVIDSDSLTRRALVVIAPNGDEIVGTIAEIYAKPGDDPDPVCAQCPGADRNRRVRGLPILFVAPRVTNGDFRGTILDPDEGEIYRCVITPDPSGRRLTLRGYVGIPLLGRTETWVRAP